jgi:hypothetical protein
MEFGFALVLAAPPRVGHAASVTTGQQKTHLDALCRSWRTPSLGLPLVSEWMEALPGLPVVKRGAVFTITTVPEYTRPICIFFTPCVFLSCIASECLAVSLCKHHSLWRMTSSGGGSGKESTQSCEDNWGATWEKSSVWSRKTRLTAVRTLCAAHATPLYLLKLALTSASSCGHSVGMFPFRTKDHGVCFWFVIIIFIEILANAERYYNWN